MFLENVPAKLLQVAGLRCVWEVLPRPVVSWERSSPLLGQRGRGAAALGSLIQELHFIEPSWRGLGSCPRRLDMWPEAGFLTAEPRPLWPPGRCHRSLCCWGSGRSNQLPVSPSGVLLVQVSPGSWGSVCGRCLSPSATVSAVPGLALCCLPVRPWSMSCGAGHL